MKVVHLNTHDITGGAARSAYRLHTGLRQMGYDSSMFVAAKRSTDPSVTPFKPPSGIGNRLRRSLYGARIATDSTIHQLLYNGFEGVRVARASFDGREVASQLPACDIVHLHWIAHFLDYPSFFDSLPPSVRLVWTLHDMNPFTGGCHYDFGCGKFIQHCRSCPQLTLRYPWDLSYRTWNLKEKVFGRISAERLHIVAPSRWLAGEVQRSALLGRFPVSIIPNGLDTDVFAPLDQHAARSMLGIPAGAHVILFVSDSIRNRRKGFDLLVKALTGLDSSLEILLVSLGSQEPQLDVQAQHLHLGPVNDDHQLAAVYSAADLFVIPSLQDNLPNTVLESLACGTAVVGFEIGGIPDMVRPSITGLLTPPGDIEALRAAIVDLVKDSSKRAEMSRTCRRIAVEEYKMELQARQYIELYERLLSGASAEGSENNILFSR